MVTTGGINELVNELKRVPILILDDFGGESNTNFIRDEVLLPILQYRMVNKKPLFITSNLDEKGILDHLSESTKEIDAQKAVRVFERIKTLVDLRACVCKHFTHVFHFVLSPMMSIFSKNRRNYTVIRSQTQYQN